MDDMQKLDLGGMPVTIPALNWIVNTLEKYGSVTITNAYQCQSGGGSMSLGMELQKALSILEAARA